MSLFDMKNCNYKTRLLRRNPYNVKDFITFFKKEYPDLEKCLKDFSFMKVCSDINVRLIKMAIDNMAGINFPFIGRIKIVKNNKITPGKFVDFGRTKKYGRVIYHDNEHSDEYVYKFYWTTDISSKIKNIFLFKFSPARSHKAYLAKKIKCGTDFPLKEESYFCRRITK